MKPIGSPTGNDHIPSNGDTPFKPDQHKQNEVYHRTPNTRHGDQGIGAPDHELYKPFPRND